MTIYVLEGPDFAGKSTLAESMEERLVGDVTIVHNGPPKEWVNPFVDYVAQITAAIERDGATSHTVFDRLHVGELIYGPVYRGESRLTGDQARAIEDLLAQAEAVKVFVDTNDVDLVERFRGQRGDDLIQDEAQLLQIARNYRILFGVMNPSDTTAFRGWVSWTPEHTKVAGY